MREYIRTGPRADWWSTVEPVNVLARTVYEKDETIDIGILDEHGNKILAREKRNPIGFVWRD